MDPSMDLLTDHQAATVHTIHHTILYQITEIATTTPLVMTHTTSRATTETTIETEDYRNQPKVQIIFEYTDQKLLEMMQMVRGFINFMKANPSMRDQFKSSKLAICKEYNNEVNESEIHSSSLDQVQQLINEDKDLVFNTLIAANYIDEVECTDSNNHQQA